MLCEPVHPRAISYREDMGFDHFQVALSVGVQKMVRSDLASSGVIFTWIPSQDSLMSFS